MELVLELVLEPVLEFVLELVHELVIEHTMEHFLDFLLDLAKDNTNREEKDHTVLVCRKDSFCVEHKFHELCQGTQMLECIFFAKGHIFGLESKVCQKAGHSKQTVQGPNTK